MPVFSIDLKVAATAYVRANSKEEAIAMLQHVIDERYGTGLTVDEYVDPPLDDKEDVYVSGLDFESPSLPLISLSPVMTIWGPWDNYQQMDQAQ